MIFNFLSEPTVLVIASIVMIMALILHNMVQSWVAGRYGDATPRLSGFMNFDPQVQLEPMGVLLLFLLGFGWPRQVPVNSRNVRGRRWPEAIIWYSGPLTYIALAFVAYVIAGIFLNARSPELFQAFQVSGYLLLLHAVVNLVPVYPLDGAKAALAWGGPGVRRFVSQIASYGPIAFILIFLVLSMSGVLGAFVGGIQRIIFAIIGLIPGL